MANQKQSGLTEKTNQAQQASKEIAEILKKHNCFMAVEFVKERFLNKEVLIYEITIKENG